MGIGTNVGFLKPKKKVPKPKGCGCLVSPEPGYVYSTTFTTRFCPAVRVDRRNVASLFAGRRPNSPSTRGARRHGTREMNQDDKEKKTCSDGTIPCVYGDGGAN